MEQDLHSSMALPDPLRCSGRLFLWPNCLDTAEDLSSLAGRLERPLDRFDAHGCVALHLDEKHVRNVLDALRKCLDPNSLEGTRAVFKPALEEPSLADVPRADSLRTFIAFARAQWLGDMISTRRLTAWFQPIVDARPGARMRLRLERLSDNPQLETHRIQNRWDDDWDTPLYYGVEVSAAAGE